MPTSARGRDPAVEEEFLGALYKGGELLASGKIVEAREHLEKAHGLAPKNEKAQNLLGLAYFKLGLFDQASEVYERLVNDNPTDATLRVNLGLVYLKTNNLERCVKEFETATDLEPTHKKAHNYLGLALAQQGNYVKAKEHFELAGSEPMAEKMGRAIAAQSSPSGFHAPVSREKPINVVIGGEPPPSAPPRPPPAPPAPPAPPPPPPKADDEVIEVMSDEELPSDAYVVPEEVAVAAEEPPPQVIDNASLNSDWGAQLPGASEEAPRDEMRFAEDEGPAEATLQQPPAEELPVLDADVAEPELVEPQPDPVEATTDSAPAQTPSWLTMEAAEASRAEEPPPESTGWVTETVSDVPLPDSAPPEEAPPPEQLEQQPEQPEQQLTAEDPRWAQPEAPPGEEVPAVADDSSWATAPAAEDPPPADEASWATAPAPAAEEPLPSTPDDDSWATGAAGAETAESAEATQEAGPVEPLPVPQWSDSPPAEEVPVEAPPEEQWSAPPPAESISASAPQPALDLPSAEPSAPLPITVEEPQDAPAPMAAPAGYTPMSPQRLVDLGASGAWVQEPSAGPFHISSDGLAVTVAGEMMVRMMGLVAIVGSVQVTPEHRRRRGRSTQEPFGTGPAQLQRVSGNGVLYLEPGRSKFHAVDLTDQNGVGIDDDGAYLREELVFAFEEAIFFENGRLTNEGQSLELAHLKGNGRVLLQLDGTLRAMPIPLGAPMVVPLHRVVGWFGRVSPRLMGFGGRGAIELTGEGYALLGTPAEGR